MTGARDRDIEPPASATRVASCPEFQIGFFLEEVFCAYVEWPGVITRGHPEPEVARLQDMGGWAADELRGRGVDPALVDRFEEVLAGVPGTGDVPDRFDEQWAHELERISQWIETFIGVARNAVGSRRARYFDFGVMLSRIGVCARTLRMADLLPPEMDGLRSATKAQYQPELARAVRVLLAFVTDRSAARPPDPDQHELDRAVDDFARYAVTWLASDDDAEQLHGRGKEVTFAAGMHSSDAISRHVIRRKYPEPLPEEERIPLAVPHSDDDRFHLHALWQEIRTPRGDDSARYHEILRDFVELTRRVLGPVHPLTLHIQVDFASSHVMVGDPDTAVLMLLDIAETALRHYGPTHPERYLIVGNVHYWLLLWNPALARQLYEFPLKSFALSDEDSVSEALRRPRAVIRQSLGLDDADRPPAE